MAGQVVEIQSPTQFTDVMASDLERVSLLYFYAPWADPCHGIKEVLQRLCPRYPNLQILSVEAEAQPEVSENFEIASVPTFVLLRGHTLLYTLRGANPASLKVVLDHFLADDVASTPETEFEEPEETQKEVEARCRGLMRQNRVMLFIKGTPDAPRCGFSQQTVALLQEEGINFGFYDVMQDDAVREALKGLTHWPTFPQVLVHGELVGGLDILKVRRIRRQLFFCSQH